MEPYLFLMIGGLVIGVASDVVKPKPRGWWRAAWIAAAIILFVAGLFLMPGHLQSDPPTPEQRIGALVLASAGGPAIAIIIISLVLYILFSSDMGRVVFIMVGLAYVAYAIIIQTTGQVPEGERWRPDQIRDGLIAVSLVGGIAHCIYLSSRRKGPPGPPPPFF